MNRVPVPALLLFASAVLASPAMTWAAGDPVRGKREFLRCALCHSAEADVHKAGPSLASVYGRTAGTVDNFNGYSAALREAEIVWTNKALDAWLEDPAALIPGNNMRISGIKDARTRRDIIAYLEQLAGQDGASASTAGSPEQ